MAVFQTAVLFTFGLKHKLPSGSTPFYFFNINYFSMYILLLIQLRLIGG